MQIPTPVYVIKDGKIFVADPANNRILVYECTEADLWGLAEGLDSLRYNMEHPENVPDLIKSLTDPSPPSPPTQNGRGIIAL